MKSSGLLDSKFIEIMEQPWFLIIDDKLQFFKGQNA